MSGITKQEFLSLQPSFPQIEESDIYYYEEACRLFEMGKESELGRKIPESVMRRMALCLTNYLQDIASDAGIWRSFVNANRHLYGWSVPFHETPENYIDYELNREDVRWITWYALAMNYEPCRDIYPHAPEILALADSWFAHLEEVYEEMPVPEKYNLARGLDFYDKEDASEIYNLGQWLFLHCYLMTPAFAFTLGEKVSRLDHKDKDFDIKLQETLDASMLEDPTGPLAYHIPEWVYLIVTGKMPVENEGPREYEPHKYYKAFTAATNGKTIAYFDSYEHLNEFFIKALGWPEGEEHLSQLRGAHDFTLMVNPRKGMLVACNVARCLADPENPYYEEAYAKEHAFELLTVRRLCPGDLLKRACSNGWLRDARFPGTDDTRLVAENADFIARCFLQQYYTGD